MNRWDFVRGYRLFFALLVVVALVDQYTYSHGKVAEFQLSNLFSFFTVESNVFVAVLFVVTAFWTANSRTRDLLRGGGVTYLLLTGVVYALFLTGLESELLTPKAWVNAVLHAVMPAVAVLDWLIDPPARRLAFHDGLIWLAFPAVYVVYTLIRGEIVGWWPYPFLNPTHNDQGYFGVFISCIVMTVILLIGIAFVALLSRRAQTTAEPKPMVLAAADANTR